MEFTLHEGTFVSLGATLPCVWVFRFPGWGLCALADGITRLSVSKVHTSEAYIAVDNHPCRVLHSPRVCTLLTQGVYFTHQNVYSTHSKPTQKPPKNRV